MVTQNTFRQFSTEVLPGIVMEPHMMELFSWFKLVPQRQSHLEPLTGRASSLKNLSLEQFFKTAGGLGLTAPPTLGAACCLLIGWLWEDQEVDFWKVEWKSLIRSWKRRLTWRRQNSSPIRRIRILRKPQLLNKYSHAQLIHSQ